MSKQHYAVELARMGILFFLLIIWQKQRYRRGEIRVQKQNMKNYCVEHRFFHLYVFKLNSRDFTTSLQKPYPNVSSVKPTGNWYLWLFWFGNTCAEILSDFNEKDYKCGWWARMERSTKRNAIEERRLLYCTERILGQYSSFPYPGIVSIMGSWNILLMIILRKR